MNFPTLEDIVAINRLHIERTGGSYFGPDNLKERGSLEWVLDAVRYPLFGADRYATLAERAARLSWTIITGHVFWDGNKRTGMTSLHLFMRLNGCRLAVTNDDIVDIACRIADQGCGYEEFIDWVRSRLTVDGATASQ